MDTHFPALYHAQHSLHPEDIPFWLKLASHSSGPILELGCGTGRVLVELAQAGHQVYGLDTSYQMLAFLRSNLPEMGKNAPQVFQGDFTRLHLGEDFSLIALPCNTYSTLPQAERLATLSGVRRHLRRGGVFAASIPNPDLMRGLLHYAQEEVEEVFPHPVDGEPVQVSSAWQRDGERLDISWYYDHLQSDGNVQRLRVKTGHMLTPTQEYQDELDAAGFKSLALYGDFDRSAYNDQSRYLIIEAR